MLSAVYDKPRYDQFWVVSKAYNIQTNKNNCLFFKKNNS